MALTVLDPTGELDAVERPMAARAGGTATLRIALLDIRKPRGDVFLDEVQRLLEAEGHEVRREAKPTFTKPAPPDLRAEISERCDAIIEALAD